MDVHLEARQRNRNQDEDVQVVVSTVVVTMPKTFSGDAVFITQTQGRPNQKSKTAKRPVRTSAIETTTRRVRQRPTSTPTPSTSSEIESSSSFESSSVESTSLITPSSIPESTPPSTLMLATSSPIPSVVVASVTASASATSTGSAEAGGMSGGAKAGLALGVLLGIGALLVGVLFLYRRKKNKAQQEQLDNEKNLNEKSLMKEMPPPPPAEDNASLRTARTMSTAPRLSLRPVTQFSPTLTEHRKSSGKALEMGATLAVPRDQMPSPSQTNTPTAATRPNEDPFGDPKNPFGNDAAADSPPNSASNAPSPQHLNDFANPASAIAAADAGPASVPLPASPAVTTPIPRKEVPSPLSIRSEAGALSIAQPSPAFTDDFPASPGPAPTGPPPIAVAGGLASGPMNAAPGPNNVHRVQLDFKPSMSDELELHAGQLVRMLHEYDDGWVSLFDKNS